MQRLVNITNRRIGLAVGTSLVALALLLILAALTAGAHAGHPQKKLFTNRWYQQLSGGDYAAWMTLSLSQPWMLCDNNASSCAGKWNTPFLVGFGDWNNQPTTVKFQLKPDQNDYYDVNVYVGDVIFNNPNILGFAYPMDSNRNFCDPSACSTIRYGAVFIADDAFTGYYGTQSERTAVIIHESGHLLALRHESVNADESVLYPCGYDNTGAIPHSVMAYDCIEPAPYGLGEAYVHDWDTCGVTHAYYDPTYGYAECPAYPTPTPSPVPTPVPACPSASAGPPLPPSSVGYYHPLTPTRIRDTRTTNGGPICKLGAGMTMGVQVAGVGGVPASGVSAVVLNTTVTEPTSFSYVTLYPSGASLPLASNLNFGAGQTVPNLVTVKLGADGKVNVFNKLGQTHVILDVAGWYDSTPGSSLAALTGPPQESAVTAGGMAAMSIDMNISGNTGTSLGSLEQCARINENDFQDADETAIDTLTLDVTAARIPNNIAAYEYNLNYSSANLTVASQDFNFLLSSNAGSHIIYGSDPLPDDNVDSRWFSSVADDSGTTPEIGSGVLDRLTISSEPQAANGQYLLALSNAVHYDDVGYSYAPNSLNIANIAINQACGPLVSPTPTPTPVPTPTPSPTPTPTPAPGSGYGYYHPLTPARILDTRTGNGAPVAKVGPGGTISVQITGRGGVPVSGVSAVVLNTTVTEPTAASYLTVFPSDASLPLASNLNFVIGDTVPNLVIVKVGSDGKVKIYNAQGSTHVIMDVAGWFGGSVSSGQLFRSLTPARILDTRTGPQGVPAGKIVQGGTISVQVTGIGGVPATGVTAVVLNATVTEPTAGSYLTIYPSDAALPVASNLNFDPGETVPNLVIVKVGFDGKVKVYNQLGQVHVIFDVAGWYGGP